MGAGRAAARRDGAGPAGLPGAPAGVWIPSARRRPPRAPPTKIWPEAPAWLRESRIAFALKQALSRVPSASVPQVIGISLLAILLHAVPAVWMHEAAHYAALRAFGLRARFARWVAVVPLGVRTDGIVPRRAYLCSLLMPALIGVTLAAPVVAASRMGASLPPMAAGLGWVGAIVALGAPDDLGRAFVILRRPEWQAFEQCESGGVFRPAGKKEWFAVFSKEIVALVVALLLVLSILALLS